MSSEGKGHRQRVSRSQANACNHSESPRISCHTAGATRLASEIRVERPARFLAGKTLTLQRLDRLCYAEHRGLVEVLTQNLQPDRQSFT